MVEKMVTNQKEWYKEMQSSTAGMSNSFHIVRHFELK